jgi:hypothetical protein
MPNELDTKAEAVRKQLGLGKSGFYRFAIIEVIKQFVTTQKNGKSEELYLEHSTLPA